MARTAADPSRLAAVLDGTGDPATLAWARDGVGVLASLPDPALAVEAAERLGNVAALQGVTAPKDLRKVAAAALHRLRSRGVKVEAQVAPTTFTLTPEVLDLPSRAFLSVPDRDGEIELLLTASDATGNCVLATIVGGPELVRETQHAHIGRHELRGLWSKVTSGGTHTELPFATGLHYAERLLAPRGEHAWHHFLDHVHKGTLASARILDPLARLPAPDADEPIPPRWMAPAGLLAITRLEEHVGKLVEMMATNTEADEAERNAAIDAALSAAADDALDDAARVRLDRYCELVLAATLHRGWMHHAARFESIRAAVASGAAGRDIDGVLASARLYVASRVMDYSRGLGDQGE